jgi:hypothetical protein
MLATAMLLGAASLDAVEVSNQAAVVAPAVPGCAGPTDPGAWYELVERSDRQGRLTGYDLRVGRLAEDATSRWFAIPPESHAGGPFGGVVLFGSDDGRRSEVRLVVAGTGCVATVVSSVQVIRRSTIDRAGRFLFYHLVDRTTREDLGIWRRSLGDPSAPVQLLPALATVELSSGPDPVGAIFSTEFAWTPDGLGLAVQSCGATRCQTRVLETTNGEITSYAASGQGGMLGVTGDLLVAYAACLGLPCPIVGTERATGRTRELAAAAGGAVLVIGPDPRLLYEPPRANGYEVAAIDLATGARQTIYQGASNGRRLLLPASRSLASASAPDGWAVMVAPDAAGAFHASARLMRATDGAQARLNGGPR